MIEPSSIEHFAVVIQQATAPAFVLTAVASLIAVLNGKYHRIIDRVRDLEAIPADDAMAARAHAEIPHLRKRAAILHNAVRFALGSAVCTTIIVIIAFLSAFLGWRHEYGVAILFCIALVLLACSVMNMFWEVQASGHEFGEHRVTNAKM
jgi:hypothetical protein